MAKIIHRNRLWSQEIPNQNKGMRSAVWNSRRVVIFVASAVSIAMVEGSERSSRPNHLRWLVLKPYEYIRRDIWLVVEFQPI